jgi:hypothetical protein
MRMRLWDDSRRNATQAIPATPQRIRDSHAVQRQPYHCTTYAPTIGPMIDPRFMVVADVPTATPRVTGPKISASNPDPTASPPLPDMPARNRHTRIVATSRASASGTWKIAQPVSAMAIGGALPATSAMGANTNGPTANPATKSATPRLITSGETLYSRAVISAEAPKMLDANEMAKTTAIGAEDRIIFLRNGQFCGFSGSSFPFQVTRHRSVDCDGVLVPLGIELSAKGMRLTVALSVLDCCFSVGNSMAGYGGWL